MDPMKNYLMETAEVHEFYHVKRILMGPSERNEGVIKMEPGTCSAGNGMGWHSKCNIL